MKKRKKNEIGLEILKKCGKLSKSTAEKIFIKLKTYRKPFARETFQKQKGKPNGSLENRDQKIANQQKSKSP